MGILEDCIDACKADPGTVVFPDCLDPRVLEAATRLTSEKVAIPLLVQSPFAVRSKILMARQRLSGFTVIDHTSKELLEKNMNAFTQIQKEKGKPVTEKQAEQAMKCSLGASAMMVRNKDVEVGIAGNLSSTADVLRAGISIIPRKQKTVSSFFLMIAPDGKNKYILADCAVVPEPSSEVLADIAIASAEKAKNLLKEEPRVAMLSFSTKGSSQHPRVGIIREAVKLIKQQAPDMLVDGELQLDAAIVPKVASLKAPASPVRGDANVLVFPSLEAGNIGYKMLQRMAGYTALGPFLQGFEGGWHDLSRGCSTTDLFNVAVLGLCMQRGDVVRPAGEMRYELSDRNRP